MTPPPAAAAAPTTVRSRRARKAPPPRRLSGPARGRAALGDDRVLARPGALALPSAGGLALGLWHALAGTANHRWLDRLIRGRAWIGIVAFALIGIVAMQLWIVKLGVGIGRALEHEGLLQRENAALSIEDAKLSSGERVEALAAARGMSVAPPGALRFDRVRGALDARLAAAALSKGQVPAAGAATTETSAPTGAAAVSTTGSSEAPAKTSASSPEATSGESASPSAPATGSEATATSSEPSAAGASSAAPASAGTSAAATATSATGEAGAASGAGTVASNGGTQEPPPGG